jgi:phosphoribosyl 1,2-cyclic phosphodiesterase
MNRLGLDIKKVRALFITHEHSDHTRGAEVISRKHRIPVYSTRATFDHSGMNIHADLARECFPHQPVRAGDLTVHPIPKLHDGRDPLSFTVTGGNFTIGVFTDIGEPCEHVIARFRQCHAAFLEANYDETMLEEGRYPYFLKKRIRGTGGHLSNDQSLRLFLDHRSDELTHLILSHLSQENNRPDLVRELFAPHANGTHIEVASRFEESELFRLGNPTGQLKISF